MVSEPIWGLVWFCFVDDNRRGILSTPSKVDNLVKGNHERAVMQVKKAEPIVHR